MGITGINTLSNTCGWSSFSTWAFQQNLIDLVVVLEDGTLGLGSFFTHFEGKHTFPNKQLERNKFLNFQGPSFFLYIISIDTSFTQVYCNQLTNGWDWDCLVTGRGAALAGGEALPTEWRGWDKSKQHGPNFIKRPKKQYVWSMYNHVLTRGHYITNPNTALLSSGSPSKPPYICMKFDFPKMGTVT